MEQQKSGFPVLMNRYQIEELIASGGMAVIYKAKDLWLERIVAVKVLRKDYSTDPAFRQRFHHEAKAAANLSHPNIVTIFDFGYDSGSLFIIMEYIPGTDLKTMIKDRQRFSIEDAVSLMVQACAGIGYAHRSGLIHCDIKPQNLLVTPDGRLKVTDFGIARALTTIQPDEKNEVVWGSPQYFAPEQAAGLAPSPASDVYSLGVILYEMLTGRLPFISNDPLELVRMHRDATPPPPHRFVAGIPTNLEQIILKVLAKEPSSRYRTADQFGQVLANMVLLENGQRPGKSQPIMVINAAPKPSVQSSPLLSLPPITPPARNSSLSLPNTPPRKESADKYLDIDWITTGLGLLTTLAVGGLIPFWLYIWFSFQSLAR
jgi:eukaryotic-like serine/threonine-protein kinase